MRSGQGAGRHDEAHRAAGPVTQPLGACVARGGAGGGERMSMLEGKVAVVTGASRGIGHAIAEELARQGAKVIGTSTSAEGAAKVPGIGKVLNVRDTAQMDTLVGEIEKQHGAIAILVNNAGITRDTLALRMKDGDWDEVMETNL